MPIWKNSEGKILVDATGRPLKCDECPCGGQDRINCAGCTEAPNEYLVVDLGEVGLTDGLCGYCDEVGGEYIATREPGLCRYRYSTFPAAACTIEGWSGCDPPHYFTVIVDLMTGRQIRVQVLFSRGTDGTCTLPGKSATYFGEFATESCRELVELTRTTQSASNVLCGGSYPSTIKVDMR